jgi:hypothetical protein
VCCVYESVRHLRCSSAVISRDAVPFRALANLFLPVSTLRRHKAAPGTVSSLPCVFASLPRVERLEVSAVRSRRARGWPRPATT